VSFIGIDLGTSFIKGGILDLDALGIKHIERVPVPEPLPAHAPLYREFDPRQVLSATRDLLTRLLPYAAPCEGLVMCSQMHGNVFTNSRGEPLSNLTTWQDQRVLMPHPSGRGSYFDRMLEQITPTQVRELGNEVRVGQPVGLFYWRELGIPT
jgi:glycerol kinase